MQQSQKDQKSTYDWLAQALEFQVGDHMLLSVPGPQTRTIHHCAKSQVSTLQTATAGKSKHTELYHVNVLKRWNHTTNLRPLFISWAGKRANPARRGTITYAESGAK